MSAIPEGFQPDTSQQWAGMDGATAWHLIYRHAEGWDETAKMMHSWLAANAPVSHAKPENQAEPLGRLCVFKDGEAAFGFSYDIAGNQQQHMRLQALDGAQIYAAPQPTKREPLTDEQISELFAEKVQSEMDEWDVAFARAIERAHGIGGEA